MALQSSGRTPAPPPPQRDDAPLLAAVAQAGAATGPCVLLDLTENSVELRGYPSVQGPPALALSLPMGTVRTAQQFFRGDIPTPLELEAAIAEVEEQVYSAHQQYRRVAAHWGAPVLWCSASPAWAELAVRAGVAAAPHAVLTLEVVERLFQRLAYVAEGRPAASEGLLTSSAFAAALLLLRELMHHIPFGALHLPMGTARA